MDQPWLEKMSENAIFCVPDIRANIFKKLLKVCRIISFSDFGKYSYVDAGSYGIAQKCFHYFISKT